jgi:hypothetical protein
MDCSGEKSTYQSAVGSPETLALVLLLLHPPPRKNGKWIPESDCTNENAFTRRVNLKKFFMSTYQLYRGFHCDISM